jgi:predicted Holliday junction resolvase-like endonuclease
VNRVTSVSRRSGLDLPLGESVTFCDGDVLDRGEWRRYARYAQTMIAVAIIVTLAVVGLAALLVVRERRAATYQASHPHTREELAAARAHSVATSKETTRGLAAEHLAPFFPEMIAEFAPGDWRFLGSPVDFVVFDGLGDDAVTRLVLVEVKSGKDRALSSRQAGLRAAVDAGSLQVEWVTLPTPRPSVARRLGRRPRIVELPEDAS